MTKQEMKTATDGEIIVDYVKTYSIYRLNLNLGGGTKQAAKHLETLDAEILKRGILSQDQIDYLNA